MRELKIHGIYRHFKGDLYLVEDIDCVSRVLDDAKKYSEWHEFKYIK